MKSKIFRLFVLIIVAILTIVFAAEQTNSEQPKTCLSAQTTKRDSVSVNSLPFYNFIQ